VKGKLVLIHLFYNVKSNRFIYCLVLLCDAIAPTEPRRLHAVSQEPPTSPSLEPPESSLDSPTPYFSEARFNAALPAVAGYTPIFKVCSSIHL
jgi:hypothetical protein